MSVERGLLLPSALLQTGWFGVLAAFVAFNTILFVGLSFGRVLFWPQPLSRRQFEAMQRRLRGGDADGTGDEAG